ncbi:MAG: hypothetical protein GY751_24170 [Bacteroidetes bacterium]|nr:hypothetical protein [Bacteroidota bacterium]
MEQLKGLVALVQEAIENGATTVEDVHRNIANKPLEMLRNVGALEGAVDKIQQIQDETIGNVYETIRMVNAQVGDIAKDMLDKVDGGE